jgi:hypothetical protein
VPRRRPPTQKTPKVPRYPSPSVKSSTGSQRLNVTGRHLRHQTEQRMPVPSWLLKVEGGEASFAEFERTAHIYADRHPYWAARVWYFQRKRRTYRCRLGALPTIRTTKQKDRFREDFATLDPEVVSACPARDKVTVMHKPGRRNAELRHVRMALAASQGRVDKLESCIGWLQRGIKRAGFESDDDFDEWCNRTGERLVAVAVEEKLQQVALSRFVARRPATNLRAWGLTVEHAALQQFRSGHLRS